MKKPILLLLASLMVAAAPAALQAQDVEAGIGVDAGLGLDLTAGSAASLISSSPVSISDITAVTDVAAITIVDISTLTAGAPGEEVASLDAALDASAPALNELRPALEANSVVVAALEAEGLAPADVVAVSVAGEGSLTIFVEAA